MRATLVFPPLASPTYVPLGIASLAAVVGRDLPDTRLTAVDGNLLLWQGAARQTVAGRDLESFRRDAARGFYDPAAYLARLDAWRDLEAQLGRLDVALRRHLACGEPDARLDRVLEALAGAILRDEPELVGFSLFGLAQLPWAVALARFIRCRGAGGVVPRIVFGGAACPALRVDDLLAACPFLDAVVEGEGEAALVALCRRAPLSEVPGLVCRDAADVRRYPPRRVPSLDGLPARDFGCLPVAGCFNPSPVLPVVYCRGCKWRRCRFCAHNTSFGRYRAQRVERLAEDLQALQERHGARHFYFADLYVDAPDLEALADVLLERRQEIRFHALGRPVRGYSRGRLAKLAAAGCAWISWGVESGSQRLLDVAGKGTHTANVERVLHDAHAAGISNLMMMIFGLPTSTDADLAATFAFIERVYPYVDAMTASAFVLFERTPFARRAEHFGLAVGGAEIELRVAGHPIRSRRLAFRERCADGALRPPRGRIEADAWHARRRWLGEVPFLEQVACEHYLLHVAARAAGHLTPPVSPPLRAA